MKPSVLSRWIHRLKTGKERQVTEMEAKVEFEWSYSYCAVGLLGKLFEEETGKFAFINLTEGPRELGLKIYHPEFAGWVGCDHWPPRDTETWNMVADACDWNDEEKLSFKEIGERLEEKYVTEQANVEA